MISDIMRTVTAAEAKQRLPFSPAADLTVSTRENPDSRRCLKAGMY